MYREIFLHPGELFFGGGELRLRTLLGSCVSMTFWHPARRIGGMCHYLLPYRLGPRAGEPDGRYADEAIELLIGHMRTYATEPDAYEVKIIGGGNMFPSIYTHAGDGIGVRNIQAARNLIKRYGFHCVHEHLHGTGHRQVLFDIPSGGVEVRYSGLPRDTAATDGG